MKRILACRGPLASAWLTTAATNPLCQMSDDECRTAVRIRLNLPLIDPSRLVPACPLCGRQLDLADATLNTHLLSCKRAMHSKGAATAGHQFVSNALLLLRHAGVSVTPEASFLEHDRKTRPDLLIHGTRGERLLTDHTVVNTSAPSWESMDIRNTLRSVALRKRNKYEAMTKEQHATFVPMPLSIYGATTDDTMRLLTLQSVTASEPSLQLWVGGRMGFITTLTAAVSVAIQKRNHVIAFNAMQLLGDTAPEF